MDRAIAAQRRDFDAGFHQFLGVCLPFVTQHVILGRDDQSRRQPRQILQRSTQRRRGDFIAGTAVRRVSVPEPLHRPAGQPRPFRKLPVGIGVEFRIRNRIEQSLENDFRPFLRLADQGHHCGHIAADTVARDRDPLRIEFQLTGVDGQILQHRESLFERDRVFRLRGRCIFDKRHRCAGSGAKLPDQPVVGIAVAENPASAVKITDQRQRSSGFFGPDQPYADRTAPQRNFQIFGFDGRGLDLAGLGIQQYLARIRNRQLVQRRPPPAFPVL